MNRSWFAWRQEAEPFESLVAVSSGTASLAGRSDPEMVTVTRANAELLPMLGASVAAGRGFTKDDDRQGSSPVALISHPLWTRRSGEHPAALGEHILLDGFTQRKAGAGAENVLMVSRLEKDGWTAPEEAEFARGFPANEPHVTPDGRKLYFGTRRPRPGIAGAEYGLWVVERTADEKWSEAKYHGPGMYVSAARNGNLYMTDVTNVAGAGPRAVVYRWTNGTYAPPEPLSGAVNSPSVADHSFIAPDESYILFDSTRPGGQGGEGDLYVCFRKPDGSWSEAMNLGDAVNTPGGNLAPSVSPDGKYIFYTANKDIYWVSAEILEPLRVKALR